MTTLIDPDLYFRTAATPLETLQLRAGLSFSLRGCAMHPERPVPYAQQSTHCLDGLQLLEPVEEPRLLGPTESLAPELLVSTVRMGFGHHRIALGIASWATALGVTPSLLDLLSSARDESRAIRRMDETYSFFSRLSADLGGPLEWVWGKLMHAGGLNTLRMSCGLASRITALMGTLPRSTPLVSVYPLNGQLARVAGFERVINIVFDNDPQYFLVVPGALNLVQSPSAYQKLRLMGVPASDVMVAGHFASAPLVQNIERDCHARLLRARSKMPRRFLISIGGAGAQRPFVMKLLTALAPRLAAGDMRVFLNMGDHRHLLQAFTALCDELRLPCRIINTWDELLAFESERDLEKSEPADERPVTLCSFAHHLEGVCATDRLMRVADVLVTKPSELAFVPVPKLHIRRVGDHEALSARRSVEIGDGTLECREIDEAVRMVSLFTDEIDFLDAMNERLIRNKALGIYDGSKRAVELALSTSFARRSPVAPAPMPNTPEPSLPA